LARLNASCKETLNPMKALVWASTFGADLWSFTRFLGQKTDARVKVVLDNPALFKKQGVAELFPLGEHVELVRRRLWHHALGVSRFGVPGFDADVTVMDNTTPFFRTSPKALMLWHGFGWKGPDREEDLWWLHRSLRRTWGDVSRPNDDFRWQCFGPSDKAHRTAVSGIAPHNTRLIGAASHDDLRTPLDRERAQPYYPFDVASQKTVLIAPTWHYGEVFAHWGTDADLMTRLVRRCTDRGANVILRLHDSFRFSKKYRAFLKNLADRHRGVMLKFKDHAPDNYLDLQVADVLVTNFSSIANLFYATGRPTAHVYPVADADEAFMTRRLTLTGVSENEVENARFIWKRPPTDHGGMLARSFPELIRQVERGLDEPDCCREAAQKFVDEHMMGADGHACERAWAVLRELVDGK
jgi:hypothetical protein